MPRVKSDSRTDPITGCFAHHIKPGCEEDFKAWHKQLKEVQKNFEGYIKTECYKSGSSNKNEWIDFTVFNNRTDLERWLRSKERKDII